MQGLKRFFKKETGLMLPDFKKILYVTNLGPESPFVFRHALSLAEHYNAGVYILHVLEPLSDNIKGVVEFYITDDQFRQHREAARKFLFDKIHKRLSNFCTRETCRLDAQVPDPVKDIIVEEGPVLETILAKANEIGAGLIVMGTHRKLREGGHRFLGSTARKVVNSAKIPVLTVYTPRDKFEDLESE
jgi:nucleotide-binding universal stress UspA family protein